MLAIRLSDETGRTGKTKTFYAREAILTHFKDLEDYYLFAETITRIRHGEESVYSSAYVRTKLGLDD